MGKAVQMFCPISGQFPGALVVAIAFVSSRCAGWSDSRPQKSIRRPQRRRQTNSPCANSSAPNHVLSIRRLVQYIVHIILQSVSKWMACFFVPLLRWHMLSGQFSGALVVAIACVTLRCTGWTNSRLRTSIRRPRTRYLFFTNYIEYRVQSIEYIVYSI